MGSRLTGIQTQGSETVWRVRSVFVKCQSTHHVILTSLGCVCVNVLMVLISIKQRLENSCKRNRWLRARLRYLQCAAIEIPQSRTKPAMESSRVRDARVAVSVRYNDSNLVVIWDRDTIYLAHIDGLVQDCSNSIANALELLPACTKPSICTLWTASSPIGQKPDDEDINCDSKPLSWILWCVLLSTCIFKFRWQSYDRSERGRV